MPHDSNFYRLYQLAYRDRSESLKALVLLVILLCGFSFASLLFLGVVRNFNWKLCLITSILWLVIFSLLPLFDLVVPKSHFYFGNLLFSFFSFLPLFLTQQVNLTLFYLIGILTVILYFAGWRLQAESQNLVGLNLARIISKGALAFTLALLIILGSLLYLSRELNLGQESLLHLTRGLPFKQPTTRTVDSLLQPLIEKQLNLLADSKTKGAASNLILEQTRQSLSQLIGIPLSGEETIGEVIVSYFKTHWSTFSLLIKTIFLLLLLSLVFSLVNIFNFFFSTLVIMVSWLLLKLLIATKYCHIKMVGIEKEELTLV